MGYYAIYEPAKAGSEHGAFSATATLNADFDASSVNGTIDQFSGHPIGPWRSRQGNITDATVRQFRTGQHRHLDDRRIKSRRDRADEWEASFYSNLVDDDPRTM